MMHNLVLFSHVITAFIIGYVVLHGTFTRVFQLPSKQLRINLILLPSMSLLALVTGDLVIREVGYSHSDLWIILTYPLLISLILINEVLIRRKKVKAGKKGVTEINVSMEYQIMTMVVVALTFLMIFRPS